MDMQNVIFKQVPLIKKLFTLSEIRIIVCSLTTAHRNTHSSNLFQKLLQYIAIILLRFKNILEGATRCESPASFQYFNILFILNVPLVCTVC